MSCNAFYLHCLPKMQADNLFEEFGQLNMIPISEGGAIMCRKENFDSVVDLVCISADYISLGKNGERPPATLQEPRVTILWSQQYIM